MSRNGERLAKLNFINNVKEYRTKNNLNQQQVARVLGIERSTYSSWETGRSMPNAAQLLNLAKIYNASVEELFSDNNGFAVASYNKRNSSSGEFLSELSSEEREIILKYRLLNDGEKEKLNQIIDEL